MGKLLLLFTVVPLVELYLLLWVAARVGFWPTVAVVLVTGLLGATLAKREGLRVLRTWQATLARGQMPEEGILGGVLVLVGGVLLVTPGILTDVVGFLLLLPPSRKVIATQVKKRLERSMKRGTLRVTHFGGGAAGPFGGPVGGPFSGAGFGRDRVDPGPHMPPASAPSTRSEDAGKIEDAEVVEDAPPRPPER